MCVCVCVFSVSVCELKVVWNCFELVRRSARDIFWWMTLIRRIRGDTFALIWVRICFTRCVLCSCVRIRACYGLRACSAEAAGKNSSYPDSITTQRPSWRGNRRLGDSTVCFTQVSWHRGWTKRPINSEMCTYKLDFTSLPPTLNVAKLSFPTSLPAACTPDVTPNPSSVRTHLSQIHFAGNCLKVVFQSLTWHRWRRPGSIDNGRALPPTLFLASFLTSFRPTS